MIQTNNCDIILLKSANPLTGGVIRWWTDSLFDHVEICLGDGNSIGSCPNGGVQIRPLTRFEDKSKYSGWCVCKPSEFLSDDQKNAIVSYAKTQIGKKYDWSGILGLAIANDKLNNPDKWFCSEFVDQCFSKGNFKLIARLTPNRATPADIYVTWRIIPYSSNILSF